MTTSGTYTFNPGLGEIVLYAYNMAGLRNTSLVQEHFQTARMATNMMLSQWSNRGVNLWAVELVTTPLVQAQATYSVPSNTVMVLDAFVTVTSGGVSTNRVILPISRTEYSTYPNPTQQGFTTVFWFDRLISPTLTLWPVPDGQSAQSLSYYRVRQIQDANLAGGQTVEIPYRWLEAFADGLAFRLAKIWNAAVAPPLKALADESYQIAADQDVEQAQQYITPALSGYFRP